MKFSPGDLIALGLISCPSFNFLKIPNILTPSRTVHFIESTEMKFFLITRFVLTVGKNGLHIWCVLKSFLGLKAEKNKGDVTSVLPSLASPLSSLYCVFFLAP